MAASSKIFTIIAMVAIFVPWVFGNRILVVDDKGWTLNFDYQAWEQGEEFHVGDMLVFKYPQGKHNIYRVDGAAFQKCQEPAGPEALATGNGVIAFSSPGMKWYICGMGNHYESGNMKLVITVQPRVGSPAASPSPTPVPSPGSSAATGKVPYGWLAAIVAILGMIMV